MILDNADTDDLDTVDDDNIVDNLVTKCGKNDFLSNLIPKLC